MAINLTVFALINHSSMDDCDGQMVRLWNLNRGNILQLEMFSIPSPCIGVCQMDANGKCLGCFRTRDERLYWMKVGPDVQRKIVKACLVRKKRAQRNKLKNSKEFELNKPTQVDLPF